jgi:hypothetical protein
MLILTDFKEPIEVKGPLKLLCMVCHKTHYGDPEDSLKGQNQNNGFVQGVGGFT